MSSGLCCSKTGLCLYKLVAADCPPWAKLALICQTCCLRRGGTKAKPPLLKVQLSQHRWLAGCLNVSHREQNRRTEPEEAPLFSKCGIIFISHHAICSDRTYCPSAAIWPHEYCFRRAAASNRACMANLAGVACSEATSSS